MLHSLFICVGDDNDNYGDNDDKIDEDLLGVTT
jgi:hypothetical protein